MNQLLMDLSQLWIRKMTLDLRQFATFALSAWLLLSVVLAGIVRARKIRPESPPFRQLVSEFAFSLRSIAVFSTVGVGVTALARLGIFPLPDIGAHWGPLWFWTSLVLMILAQDAYLYWVHRLMHRPRVFRSTHRRHHLSNNPSPFTAYSFDVPEALLMVLFLVLWFWLTPTPWPVADFFMIHQIVRNTLHHCGHEFMPARRDGRPHLDFLATTTHHDLHHADAGWNYGAWFTWWDRLMGTEHPDYYARYSAAAPRIIPSKPPQPSTT